uniref:Uncharacterized protein n=1 Tax=Mus musculus TaxID=10090 RepID=Q8CBW0_MOUSE|nr:unnamed protein product [Mus musculus]
MSLKFTSILLALGPLYLSGFVLLTLYLPTLLNVSLYLQSIPRTLNSNVCSLYFIPFHILDLFLNFRAFTTVDLNIYLTLISLIRYIHIVPGIMSYFAHYCIPNIVPVIGEVP